MTYFNCISVHYTPDMVILMQPTSTAKLSVYSEHPLPLRFSVLLKEVISFLLFQESSLTIDDVTFRVFSKVLVQIKVETSASRNRFVNISLVQPSVGIYAVQSYLSSPPPPPFLSALIRQIRSSKLYLMSL